MSLKEDILEEKSSDELSGFPLVAESVKLEDHMPSNSSLILIFSTLRVSIINPVSELWDSNILTIFFEFKRRSEKRSY